MFTERVRLVNFRNHSDSIYDFQKLNYLEGDNGAGKTSVLESLFILFNLKSFRQQSVKKAISFKEDSFHIQAKCSSDGFDKRFEYFYDGSAELKDESGKVKNKADYLAEHPCVCYSPEYRQIVSDDQDDRRRFIDKLAFHIDKAHFDRLTALKKINAMKVSELKKDGLNRVYIDSLNEKIAELSKKISGARECVVLQLNDKIAHFYDSLGFKDSFRLDFRSNHDKHELFDKEYETRKLAYGSSRDKLYSISEGLIYDRFSSFGQKKTFVLLSLAASLKMLEENGKNDIITLLDDFEAGLDENRIWRLFELFNSSSQIFVTGVKNINFQKIYSIRIQVKDEQRS